MSRGDRDAKTENRDGKECLGRIKKCGREVAQPAGTYKVPFPSAHAFIPRDITVPSIWAQQRKKQREKRDNKETAGERGKSRKKKSTIAELRIGPLRINLSVFDFEHLLR